jgi:hypothetical protein
MLTPVNRSAGRPSGASLWRKQILPLGEIDYKGRKIAFTREYLSGLVRAFRDGAYDVVPLQFADGQNAHTNAPEQRRGTIKDLELTDDGLDIIVAAGADAAQHLSEYPDLGVSARIVEDYQRADGKFFPAAIQHVLGTLDPRITGLRPWQAIDAANDDAGEVIDLTDAAEAPEQPAQQPPAGPGTSPTEEHAMALTADQEARLGKLLDLPEEQFSALLTPPAEPDGTEGEDVAEEELTDAELSKLLADVDAEIAAEAAQGGAEGTGKEGAGAEPEPATAGAQLSAEAQAAIDLANSRAEQTEMELARVTQRLAAEAYRSERDLFARQYGIPPRIFDLARPVLEGEGRTVDLANGKTADAGAIVRKVLTEVGKTCKMLDLSAELGTPLDGGEEAARAAEAETERERGEMVSAVRKMAGI